MLKDKVALVTGAATGIGEEIARYFAENGARVFLLDRDAALNAATAERIRGLYGFAAAAAVDVCDPASIALAVNAAVTQFGAVDILVNNAGIYPRAKFVEMTEAEWDQTMNVNLKGVFHCMQAVLPGMMARRAGKIVNISSVTFHLGTPLLSHYVASKGGMIGLTRSVARETGEFNVHVNCLTPGGIQTPRERQFVTPQQEQEFKDSQCLKRRITPLDIARVALFLGSELSDGMTGQTVNVDGGWAMY